MRNIITGSEPINSDPAYVHQYLYAMKTWKTFLTLCLLSISYLIKSQVPPPPPPPPSSESSDIASKATGYVNEGNIKEAVAEYKKLAKLYPGELRILYNYACVLSLDRQSDSTFRYLYIVEGIEPSSHVFTDPDLINLRDDPRWQDFENHTIVLINKKTENSIKDIGYAKKLWKLLCLDQYSFYETGLAVRKLGPDSPVVGALRRLQDIKNQNNLKELEVLLSDKGWPRRSQVGQEAAGAAFYVLQHSNAEAQQKYIEMFGQSCRENEGDWTQYALMFDRMRMNQNLPQRYGTHSYMDPASGKAGYLYPLEDETKVDGWRKEVGLEPLKDFLTRTGLKYEPISESKK